LEKKGVLKEERFNAQLKKITRNYAGGEERLRLVYV